MFEILTVCTGNICRSPLAETLLRTRLAAYEPRVHSAGTMGLDSSPMTPEAVRLAVGFGVAQDLVDAHLSRYLTEAELRSPDLILAMSREHRRKIVELAPARLRSTFTLREFARLANDTSDEEIAAAAVTAGADGSARARAAVATVAAQRGMSAPPADPADDDVIDPYRRSWDTYQLSASQLVPAIDQVVRVMSVAMTAR
ncbi:arsenate reductase/protein-tyrosine-phosphatase family protein [Microbacterium gallinarum]|uniref:Low molecular weight phosphatase family protein n=1 Tax=Microbacterium gallinarum TaxID=2762209 RepID=A0ABR8X341_9MICO|nr:low molecular weight phosphatase family protein [Microbacterium gallinarum]MBD8023749.1 low molecular weight phosphatase family protein [Microbacterium gallinarum]